MKDIEQAVALNIRQKRMLSRGERVVVAVSGGVDSMVLLHLLNRLATRHEWKLLVCHFNHQLRGKSSDADARLVKRVTEKLGLRFETASANVRQVALRKRISLEMAARELRHRFFASCAKKFGAAYVALAHHADDQLEQFFLRLFRGTGGRALSGMQWQNVSPADAGVHLIRPLLNQSKSLLEAYAKQNKIPYREDATNRSVDILRNRIRHELLPLLKKKYQPGLQSTISRIQEIIGAESELVNELAMNWLEKSQNQGPKPGEFGNLHIAVQRRILQLQLEQHRIGMEFELVEKLRLQPTKAASVRHALEDSVLLFANRTKTGRVELKRNPSPLFSEKTREIRVEGSRSREEFGGLWLEWRIQQRKGLARPDARSGREWFDAEQVGKRILLRFWQPGDRYQPIGSPKSVKLQDIFVNARIPRQRRHELVLACTGKGDIFWVEGLRISERFKLTEQTNRRLQWRWKRL